MQLMRSMLERYNYDNFNLLQKCSSSINPPVNLPVKVIERAIECNVYK